MTHWAEDRGFGVESALGTTWETQECLEITHLSKSLPPNTPLAFPDAAANFTFQASDREFFYGEPEKKNNTEMMISRTSKET